MKLEIKKYTFSGCLDAAHEAAFPLVAVMSKKNDYCDKDVVSLEICGKPVAMAIVDADGYPLNAKLCAFEVRHGYRHRGFGKRLLMHIVSEYEDLRAVVLREAVGFYRKCFFMVIEDNGGPVVTVETIA